MDRLEYRSGPVQRKKYTFIPLIKILLAVLGGTIIAVVWFSISRNNLVVIVALTSAWVVLIHLAPFLIIGFRHNQISKNAYFIFDKANNRYRYKQDDIDISFANGEIEKVIIVVSPPTYDNRVDLLGFGHFFYWKVILKNGGILTMSCMLLDRDDFFGSLIHREKQWFPIPPSNRGLRQTTPVSVS